MKFEIVYRKLPAFAAFDASPQNVNYVKISL